MGMTVRISTVSMTANTVTCGRYSNKRHSRTDDGQRYRTMSQSKRVREDPITPAPSPTGAGSRRTGVSPVAEVHRRDACATTYLLPRSRVSEGADEGEPMSDEAVLGWLAKNHDKLVSDLAALVAVRSISTDGEHAAELDQSARLTCDQMREAGVQNGSGLKTGEALPYAYGEWLDAPGKPTVFLYAHHDVQPVNDVGDARWKQDDPFQLTRRKGRLFGRGAADDKGAITAQLGAISAWLKTTGQL